MMSQMTVHVARSAFGKVLVAILLATLSLCSLDAREVSPERARRAVGNWLQHDKTPLGAKLGGRLRDSVAYRDTAGEPLFYVVKLDGGGFVVTAADDAITPIIAFSESGEFVASEDNPLWVMLNNDLPQRKSYARSQKLKAGSGKWRVAPSANAPNFQLSTFNFQLSKEPEEQWAELDDEPPIAMAASVSDQRVAPLVRARWHQASGIYNYYTPNNYSAGCVATAGAQVMRHHEWPQTAVTALTNSCRVDGAATSLTMKGGVYNWSNMPFTPTGSATEAQKQEIGKLLYDVGVAVRMNYASGGSGANISDLKNSLTGLFKYADAAIYFQGLGGSTNLSNAVLASIDANCPVVFHISGRGNGHAVVGDGYGYTGHTLYVHLNMGWGGASDAWYNLPNIGTSFGFNFVNGYVFNVSPRESGEIISGRILDHNSQPVSGATVTAASGSLSKHTRTNANGIYALWVPSGATYNVTAQSNARWASLTVGVGVSNRGASSSTMVPGNRWGQNLVLDLSSIELAPSSKSVQAPGEAFTVNVTANVPWTATSNAPSWLTVTPADGSKDGTLNVTVAANAAGASRSGTITVTGGGITRTVAVRQAAATLVVTPPTRSVSPSACSFNTSITSNTEWTASSSEPSWLSVSPASGSGNGVLNVAIDENTGTTRTGMITVTTGGLTRTIAVTQAPGGSAAIPLDTALGNTMPGGTALTWTGGDGASWFGQTTVTRSGANAAQSGTIGDAMQSELQTTVFGTGVVSFWWKVSSEKNGDFFQFYIDGVLQASISGEQNWKKYTFTIPTGGEHTLKWVYVKNEGHSSGNDAGWLDDVMWGYTYPVYETKVSAKTSVVKDMNVKVTYVANGSPKTRNVKVHYRAPVTKSYTILMAHDGNAVGDYTATGYGRMGLDKQTVATFDGEALFASGLTIAGKPSFIGTKGQNLPVTFKYFSNNASKPILDFTGLATLKNGDIATATGTVIGSNIFPARCATHTEAEQGDFVNPLAPGETVVPYCPAEYAFAQESHFHGTFAKRYNATLSKKPLANWDGMKAELEKKVPGRE